ncbi:MAG: alpha/beta hydrolase [Pseudomonadota bacterium]
MSESHVTHFASNGPVQTAYHDLASQSTRQRAPLLFVHGFTGAKLDFADQLAWFAERRRVLAYDQRGHGESSNLSPYNFYTLAADLINFLDVLGIDQCHVVGHSLGGMVVMRALLSAPTRFRSAILMDTAASAVPLMPADSRRKLAALVNSSGCAALLDGMRGQPQNAAVQRSVRTLGEQEYWRRIRVKLTQMDSEAFVTLSELLNEHPSVLDTLTQLNLPTTVMVGAEDIPFVEPSRALADKIPGATLVVIDQAGHSPQYENPDAWRAAIDAHLDSFEPPRV